MKILVVDDSNSMRNLVAQTLIGAGYEVVQAKDGREALTAATSHTLAAVISDINMPVMDGLSFVRELRKQGKFTPVIMLTTEASAERKAEAKQAGATGWMVKPFEPSMLLTTIKRVL